MHDKNLHILLVIMLPVPTLDILSYLVFSPHCMAVLFFHLFDWWERLGPGNLLFAYYQTNPSGKQ